jgi:hypothetical protein
MLPLQNEVCSLIVQTVLVFPFSVAKITQWRHVLRWQPFSSAWMWPLVHRLVSS